MTVNTGARGAIVGDAIARLVDALNTPDQAEERVATDALVELYVDLIAENERLGWECDLPLELTEETWCSVSSRFSVMSP